jgi:hypothetical protein
MARGRPSRQNEPSTEKVETRLTVRERIDLQAVAREHGQPVSVILREAVNEFVADYRERRVFVGKNSSSR